MTTMDALQELENAGAVYLDKHFVYASGKHGPAYINCDPLFPRVDLMAQFCERLVQPFRGEVDTVVAPATGGIVLAVLAAKAFIERGEKVHGIWADKSGDGFAFERAGFLEHVTGKRVLVVEDLLNTGGSVEKVCRLAERHGAELVGVSVVCNRGNSTAESLGVPRLEMLARVQMQMFAPGDCPLCEQHIPIVEDVAHGKKFKDEHPAYAGGYITLL